MTLEQALRSNETDLANYLLNDPQGRKVVSFLSALVRDFAALSARRTRSTERVSRTVNQIVDAIRVQGMPASGAATFKDIHVASTVRDAVTVLDESLPGQDIAIHVNCDAAPKMIRVQRDRLTQMLVNLIRNAIEAVDKLRFVVGLRARHGLAHSELFKLR